MRAPIIARWYPRLSLLSPTKTFTWCHCHSPSEPLSNRKSVVYLFILFQLCRNRIRFGFSFIFPVFQVQLMNYSLALLMLLTLSRCFVSSICRVLSAKAGLCVYARVRARSGSCTWSLGTLTFLDVTIMTIVERKKKFVFVLKPNCSVLLML